MDGVGIDDERNDYILSNSHFNYSISQTLRARRIHLGGV